MTPRPWDGCMSADRAQTLALNVLHSPTPRTTPPFPPPCWTPWSAVTKRLLYQCAWLQLRFFLMNDACNPCHPIGFGLIWAGIYTHTLPGLVRPTRRLVQPRVPALHLLADLLAQPASHRLEAEVHRLELCRGMGGGGGGRVGGEEVRVGSGVGSGSIHTIVFHGRLPAALPQSPPSSPGRPLIW